ncbi:hypothetical protein AQUCO_00600363v1 [Aquilegia coerulea]|uniref:Uncharacterized protein n=1 Tax=Aquilegia coerulea TaxID=218851 RepID=A0A2G5EPE4_AQUCA|nr:hypothetical protein AQUCO_00600363v1 [Aquilegia coerulea]
MVLYCMEYLNFIVLQTENTSVGLYEKQKKNGNNNDVPSPSVITIGGMEVLCLWTCSLSGIMYLKFG